MKFQIVNIVDDLSPLNSGIWHAALSQVNELRKNHDVQSHLIAPKMEWQNPGFELAGVQLLESTRANQIRKLISTNRWSQENTIIATHGCWNFPTRWGRELARIGFPWVVSPQGMLEPWSLRQRWMAKQIYFQLLERPWLSHAAMIRAVSTPEQHNLGKLFGESSKVVLIPNSVPVESGQVDWPRSGARTILFLGRLHKKKCPLELTEAFVSSSLRNRQDVRFIIAGPDQGQASLIRSLIASDGCRNAELREAVFGESKKFLLSQATFFVLPSQSEGFPTAVVEAMGYGCIPILSEGCNFPEAEAAGLSFRTGTSVESIRESLESAIALTEEKLVERRKRCVEFIRTNYSNPRIASMQFERFGNLLNGAAK